MLLYFILGVLFAYVGITVLENISSLISAYTQYLIHVIAYKISKIKKQVQELHLEGDEEDEENTKIPMGFHTDLIGTEIYQEDQQECPDEQEDN